MISVGYKNRFGHPHDEITERLDRHGIKTYRTDISGAIVFYSNGRTLKSHTYTGL